MAIKKNEKYNANRIAERHRDHSLYTAFAPADKPRIAIAVVVENGGFGATAAAPIVRKALDYYLLGKRPAEKEPRRVPKEDAELRWRVQDIQAEQGVPDDKKPGAETPGNRE
jgi:penicillin-binding protein 2